MMNCLEVRGLMLLWKMLFLQLVTTVTSVVIVQEYNVFGADPLNQFAAVINLILQQKQSFHVLVVNDKTMIIIVDSNGTLIFFDSHIHGHHGALVARSDPYQGHQAQSFSNWVDDMLRKSHSVGLAICSLTTVGYF